MEDLAAGADFHLAGFHTMRRAGHHVGVAAGIFGPLALALGHQNRGCHPVEEVAVVADQQDRTLIVGQHLLQQVERFEIEVIGRLVEHQQIRGLGQFARQDAAAPARRPTAPTPACAPVPAGTGSPSCSSPHGAISPLMITDCAAAISDDVGQQAVGIEALAALVQRHDLQVGAEPDAAAVRLQLRR